MSIRAIMEQGRILPLEPIPSDWNDGVELAVEAAPVGNCADAGDSWLADLDALAKAAADPEDWALIDAALAEADTLAKDQLRREMGLN